MIQKNKKRSWLSAFFIMAVLSETNSYAFTQDPDIKIGNRVYTLSQLKKQFKPVKVTVFHNPAYANEKKEYCAFPLNPILSKLLDVDFNQKNSEQVLLVDTLDDYLSQIPIPHFTTKGRAYLAYREVPGTISEKYRTKDGFWSYVTKDGKKVNPGPYYIIWDNSSTYPTGWPYQVVSMSIVNKNP
ncbi:hypothetical protein E3983_11660 [Legionella israelensis]|uniref:Putative signal peptide protein n=1 Tax=Legionella israelensis TaxID=454 RepID=A0A0W0V2R9_9GAMM|nr:hypothetical protein [Legionella israelensis]KTD14412.1 putative signal peptide protein [Legionella israelensis]QBR84949.1 hypothetical protein E3983_11660 [Legionella israelensis]QBS10166.1 hypothetical protein E4T55_10045 [Legionella israelensis]SCY35033.1 hypothetical protein SAMN02746069_02134 [Legionella israelensis DSM 19235]STX59757.1 putative signal peptide protein [Legionella israelensis]